VKLPLVFGIVFK